MKTPDRRSYEERREIKLAVEPSNWEELGKVIVQGSLIILVFIVLVVYGMSQLNW